MDVVPAFGQDAPAEKSVAIARARELPTIDGVLGDDEWAEATVLEDFHQVSPAEYSQPSVRTRIYLKYGEDALYVGARMFDDPNAITANILKQGEGLQGDDRIGIVLAPFNDRRGGYTFIVNPNSVRRQALFENATSENFNWKGIWDARAVRDAEGWTAEMEIPFKTLSFDPANPAWGFNFERNVIRRAEVIGWSSRNQQLNPATAGTLAGFSGLTQGIGLDVVPAVSLRQRRDFVTGSSGTDVEPSLDVFYKITPALTAALTINTDFSATEVDDREVNLTRFDLFFPEKRAFFLQDADIFEFGRLGASGDAQFPTGTLQNGRPFFSRRIGLAATGEPIDLRVGAKVTGRIGAWSLGLLDVQQAAYDAIDSRNLFVGRAAANVLDESTVGAIVTHGDPRSNLDNTLVGVDFLYRNTRLPGGRLLEGELWYQQTETENLTGDDQAFGARLRSPNNTGLRGGFGVKEIGRNFHPALGFVNNAGIRDYTAEAGYTHRPEGGLFQSVFTGMDAQHIRSLDDGLLTEEIRWRALELVTQAGDEIEFAYARSAEAFHEDFEIFSGIVVPRGEYDFDTYEVELTAAAHRPLSGSLTYSWGDFLGGERRIIEGEILVRPSPHFAVGAAYEYNDVTLPQGRFIARVMRLKTDVVFSAMLSWSNFIQYDNDSELIGANSRLQWIPEAGREVFLALNHALEDVDGDGRFHSENADVVLKAGYTFRF